MRRRSSRHISRSPRARVVPIVSAEFFKLANQELPLVAHFIVSRYLRAYRCVDFGGSRSAVAEPRCLNLIIASVAASAMRC